MRRWRSSIASIVAVALLGGACTSASRPTSAPPDSPAPTASAVATAVPTAPSPSSLSSTDAPPRLPTWTATGALVTPHAWHLALLLRDGRVLVAGGLINDRIDGQVATAAELYDPVLGTWTSTGPMVEPRWGHHGALLTDGRVLVTGGYIHGSDPLASTECYDPDTGTWTASGAMAQGRGGHTATLLVDGTMLVVGGSTIARPNGLASTELYDPESGSWLATAAMGTARQGHTATALRDGRVLVVGGGGEVALAEGPSYSSTAEIYDPRMGRWAVTGNMAMARAGHSATLLSDGSVFVVGGSVGDEATARSAEVYDPSTGIWSMTSSMAGARTNHSATLLPDGTVLVAGGVGLGSDPPRISTVEVYDPDRGSWSTTAAMVHARGGFSATSLRDGRVLVVGDYAEDTGASAEVYDPGGGT